ncbi:MAG: hypothetical protein RLZZ385_902 [Pseudomonadota bacterium]|jgi:hypothetical protein
MTDKILQPRLKNIPAAGSGRLDRIRWSLRQRLCGQLRQLSSDLFDEVDDFLFSGGQRGQFGVDGSYLKAMREIRTKRELFEEAFLCSLNVHLRSQLDEQAANPVAREDHPKLQDTVYEKMEVDLALQAMQRKALKFYAPFVRQLETIQYPEDGTVKVLRLRQEFLVTQVVAAFEKAQEVFSLTLEIRLIFLKLFEQHLLMKMERIYMDTISVLSNQHDDLFVARLYSSSTAFRKRNDQSRIDDALESHQIAPAKVSGQRSVQIEECVDQLIEAMCTKPGVPQFMERMLRNQWRKVMFVIGLNAGTRSAEFEQCRATADRLLAVMLNRSQCGRQVELDALQSQLQKGFDLVQLPAAEQDHLLAQLATWQKTSIAAVEPKEVTAAPQKAIGVAGKKYLQEDDLDEIVAMLSASNAAAAQKAKEESVDSLVFHLNLVDNLEDGATLIYTGGDEPQLCQLHRSRAIDNSYQICNRAGRVVLTRSRLGLAISLREGQLRVSTGEAASESPRHTVLQSIFDKLSTATLQ